MASDIELNENFQRIGLEGIADARLMKRVDTKFLFPVSLLKDVLTQLELEYDVLTINARESQRYSSLYFDTDGLQFYNEHHNGKRNRFKVRLRNYMDSNQTFLEVKERRGRVVDKKRIIVDAIDTKFKNNERNFIHSVTKSTAEYNAVLFSEYDRITLVSKDRNERVTLDTNLSFRRGNDTVKYQNVVIAELKQIALNRASTFYQEMKSRGLRPFRISKYCIGCVDLLSDQTIKKNNFKRKLLKIREINNCNNK